MSYQRSTKFLLGAPEINYGLIKRDFLGPKKYENFPKLIQSFLIKFWRYLFRLVKKN